MTTHVPLSNQPMVASSGALPLRQDDPLSLLFMAKTLGILVLLLLAAYLALRWYAGRSGNSPSQINQKKMQCVQELRLSVKTRAYLLDVEGRKMLVIDSASGTSIARVDDNMAGSGS